MALIACPECGREVSSSAAACPACAYPVATGTPVPAPLPPPASARKAARLAWWKLALSMAARAILGFILVVTAAEGEQGAGIVGGLVIAASAIPTWYRDRMERLRRGTAGLDGRLEQRLTEIEERHRAQLRQLHEMHEAQVAELEERIDFAERLLTKQRDQIG